MSKFVAKTRSLCGKVCQEIIDLLRRKFVSEYHRRAWVHFEKLLYVRTMMYMTSRIVIFLIASILGDLRFS